MFVFKTFQCLIYSFNGLLPYVGKILMVFISIIFYANQVKNYSQSKNNLQKFYYGLDIFSTFSVFYPKKYLALYLLSFCNNKIEIRLFKVKYPTSRIKKKNELLV